jgi:hypothetical protein
MRVDRRILIAAIIFILGMVGLLLLTISDGRKILNSDDSENVVYSNDEDTDEDDE